MAVTRLLEFGYFTNAEAGLASRDHLDLETTYRPWLMDFYDRQHYSTGTKK